MLYVVRVHKHRLFKIIILGLLTDCLTDGWKDGWTDGEESVYLLSSAKVPWSKAPNPYTGAFKVQPFTSPLI